MSSSVTYRMAYVLEHDDASAVGVVVPSLGVDLLVESHHVTHVRTQLGRHCQIVMHCTNDDKLHDSG